MHQQEVGGVGLLAFQVGHPGCHRHGGHTGGADEGVDLAAGELAHHHAAQHTAGGGQQEGHHAQHHDHQGLGSQEGGAYHGSAHGGGQEDGDNVHHGVLHGVGQTVGNAGLLQQVTQHQAANERCGIRQEQGYEDGNHDGEHDLLGLGHIPGLDHLDLSLRRGGQQLHHRGLNHGNQRHVGVGRHGDGAQQMGSQLRGEEDGGGAVGAADDTDGSALGAGEAQENRAEESGEHAQLSGSAQQQALGVGQQGAKVSHGAYAHENQAGVQACLDADVEDIQQAAFPHDGAIAVISGVALFHEGVPQLLMVQACTGQVGQQTPEGDAHQEQRLKLLHNAQVQKDTGDHQHNKILPAAGGEPCEDPGKAGIVPQVQ